MVRSDPLFQAWTPSRSLDAYLQSRAGDMQDPAWRQLLGVTPAALSEYAGAPGGTVRALEYAPGYQAASTAADVLGPGIQKETAGPGLLQRTFDFIDRPRSAALGFVTGLDRLTRYGNEAQGIREDVAAPGETGLQVGLRRAVASLKGEENYRFQDFTNIAREGDEVSGGNKFGNAALGLVVDTIIDPITYLSFGGSILGRKNASEYIAAKTTSWIAPESKAGVIIRSAFSKPEFNSVRYIERNLASNAYDKRLLIDDLNKFRTSMDLGGMDPGAKLIVAQNLFSFSDDIAEISKKAEKIYAATGTDLLREHAKKVFPVVTANTYAAGNIKLMRKYVTDVMGKDFADAYIKMLPYDIQGGLRIRLPFSKNADGVPIAFKVPGIGGGQLSEKFKFIDKATDLTERGRYYLSTLLSGPILSKITGANGELWFKAVAETRGRLLLGRQGRPAMVYSDYMYKTMTDAANRSFNTKLNRAISEEITQFLNVYKNVVNQYAKDLGGEREVHRLFDNIIGVEDGWADALARLSSGELSKAEEAVLAAGAPLRAALDRYGQTLVEELNITNTQAVSLINFYLPHHITAREAMDAAAASGAGAGGVRVNPTKSRNRALAGFEISEDGGISNVRWRGAVDANDWLIFRQEGAGDMFMENPLEYIPKYFAETVRALEDFQYVNTLRKYGLTARAEFQTVIDFNERLLRMNAAELFETDLTDEVASFFAESNKILGIQGTPDAAPRVIARANKRQVEQIADHMRRLGVTLEDRKEVESAWKVISRDKSGFPKLVRNSFIDATAKVDKNGRWYIYFGDKDEVAMRYKGNQRSGVKYFDDMDTETKLLSALTAEARVGGASLQKLVVTALRESTALKYWEVNQAFQQVLLNEPKFSQELLDFELLARQGVPLDEQIKLIEQHIQKIHDALALFGRDKGRTRNIKMGSFEGTVVEQIREEKKVMAQSFKDFLATEDFSSITGVGFSGGASAGRFGDRLVPVKQRIANEMAEEYAPYALMSAISRKFQIMNDPNTWGQRFIEHFLKPFYAMNKVWMTLGRGPGFIVRNVQGGLWNLLIHDVGRVDMLLSSRRNIAVMSARSRVKQKYGKDIFNIEPATAATDYRQFFYEEMEKFYKGSDSFIPGRRDIDAIMDMEDAYLNQGVDASRLSARLVGEIMNSGREQAVRVDSFENGKKVTRWIYPSGSEAGLPRGRTVTSEQIGASEKALRWLATENPWIHSLWGPMNDAAENYMRYAAFSKGVRDFGLEADERLRGFSASLWTKWTQFDYADLSDFERTLGKAVIPFWTWTRYNVPLVFRTVIHRPGVVATAIRAQESLASVFAEEDDDGWPTSSFLQDRMGFLIQEEQVRNMFESLGIDPASAIVPKGDIGVGLFVGENILDVNRFLRTPGEGGFRGLQSVFNTREIWQNGNPLLAGLGTVFAGAEGDPTISMTDTEQAPGWMSWLPGLRKDPITGEKQASRYVTEATRTFFPFVRHLERYAPTVFGGEREPGRWFTSLASGIFGVPVSTEDDWKAASEMDRRTEFIKLQLEETYGRAGEAKLMMIRSLLENGAPMSFIQNLEIQDMGDDEVDVANAVQTWKAVQRLNYLVMMGVPEEDILVALMAYVPEGMPVPDDIESLIYNFLPKPKLDVTQLSNMYGLRAPTEQELAAVGVTPDQVRLMSEQELQALIVRLNPGRFTMDAEQARFLEWVRTQNF